ncbi:protein FAM83A-like [Halichoeres trimaculatus]|uniref:protein FAM83A-like n=1 Tax=Halichoeres trimaculatus TaxID=147232 RepID=UPI003D9E4207
MDLSPTDGGSVSVLLYKKSKPLGKVRRRVQDLRHKVSAASSVRVDLSHNEAARLAMDSLLSRGLEGYKEVLSAEGEVDFLSVQEKKYILKHGLESNTADLDASADRESEDSSGSKSSSQCPTVSTNSDLTVADMYPSKQKGAAKTSRGPGQFKIYFQSDSRACGMKDVVIELIRKAQKVLAIVIDSFSDMELLFDLLEATKNRNVSVYLLLDHLNLDHFVSMWQHLKLNSKHFPNLSVRSVGGQTYCAKTGWKLTGQIAESFLIADWTEVLTGSFSFSWLSWHVYRSLVVLLKGGMAEGFHHEFLRLYANSKPVSGFINVSLSPLDTFQSTQDMGTAVSKPEEKQRKPASIEDLVEDDTEIKPKMPDLAEIQSPESKCSTNDKQPPSKPETGTEMPEKPAQMDPKRLVQDLQSAPEGKPENTGEAVSKPHDAQTNMRPQEKEQNKIHTQDENTQSQPESPTDSTTSESKVIVQDSQKSADRQQTASWLKQSSRNILTKPAGLNTPRRHWNCTLDFQPNMDFVPDHSMPLSPGATWHPQPITPQQVNPTARFTWIPQSHRVARQNSFEPVYRTGQNQNAQVGWRPFQSSMYSGLQRSRSMNERHSGGFMRAGRHLSVS